jgi:prepilin-type processing-associated H-X9-DG protein
MGHNKQGKVTLAELLTVVGILFLLVWLVFLPMRRHAIEARQARCRQNLNQLAKGLATYLGECGDNRYLMNPLGRGRKPDDFTGAEWLASLYWTQIIPDPGVFLCPGTPDTNDGGKDIGRHGPPPTFGSRTVSYAGLHRRSFIGVDGQPLPIYEDLPPFEPVASDDTEGTVNHGEWGNSGMNVLFFDSHTEFLSRDKLDPRTAVGATGPPVRAQPLLWRLRN